MFKKSVEERIDSVIQGYFIEYIREDLTKRDQTQKLEGTVAGSLLGGDEKVGIERLIESLQCCMWSSMIKKNAPLIPVSGGASLFSLST